MNVRDCVDMYDGGIRYVDDYIGRLIEKTKQLGIYNDLMLVVVSDHGEHLRNITGCHFIIGMVKIIMRSILRFL